ncbi:MAG: hypothetical protein ACTSVV_17115, partial [Promethearchaeota archaeon]
RPKIYIGLRNSKDLFVQKYERTFAHEATHSYLQLNLGYLSFIPIKKVTRQTEIEIVHVTTLTEDIVVNKIIQEHGFAPLSSNYINHLIDTIDKIKKKNSYNNDISPKNRIKIFICYMTAWLNLKYLSLDHSENKFLKDYLIELKKFYPKIEEKFDTLLKSFSEFDVFTKKGHSQILKRVLDFFNFSNLGEFKSLDITNSD